jgi:hypothetical protein
MPQEGVYYEEDYYSVGGDNLYCRLFFNGQYGNGDKKPSKS